MKTLRRFLMGLGGLAALAMLLTLVTPGKLHGIAAALVRDVDNPALAPLRVVVDYNLAFINDQRLVVTVPAGKRLIIENVSFWSGGPTGDELVFAALRNGQFGSVLLNLEIHPPHPSALSDTHTIQDGSQMVRVSFEPGEQVWISASHNTGANRSMYAAIHGYYVTL